MPYDPSNLLGFSLGILVSIPAILMFVHVIRSSEVSRSLKIVLGVSLILCILPYLLFSVAELTRVFIYYDEGAFLGLILFFGGPLSLLVGNAIAVGGFLRNWGTSQRRFCGHVTLTNAGYLLFCVWLLLNVKM
jgi:hypothetical protein